MTLYSTVSDKALILASSSPRRKELLGSLGVTFKIVPSDLNEEEVTAPTPEELAKKLALLKAQVVAEQNQSSWVLGADSIVVLSDNTVLNKPADKEQARRMLSSLSASTHSVITGISLISVQDQVQEVHASQTSVTMRKISDGEIESYVSTDEPYDKAGGYGLQGLASVFVHSIQGSHTNVIGLDISLVATLLLQHGVIRSDR